MIWELGVSQEHISYQCPNVHLFTSCYRCKLDIDMIHHVEGKSNPTDVGTRPELVTADSVKPGSVWLTGTSWMKLSINKAKEIGVIRSAKDIKLSNDEKKVFKKEMVYD